MIGILDNSLGIFFKNDLQHEYTDLIEHPICGYHRQNRHWRVVDKTYSNDKVPNFKNKKHLILIQY